MAVYKNNSYNKNFNEQNTITSIYYNLGVIRDLLHNINDILYATEHQAFTLRECETKDYILNTLDELHTTMCSEPIEFMELYNELQDLFADRKKLN